MDRTLCFIIEDQNIYLEQVLVEYMGVPIFFFSMMKSNDIWLSV